MEATRLAFAGALLVLIARAALGQQPAVVQLPTYSYFAVGTTVSVPDRGAVSLGGIDRARSDAQSFASPLSPRGNSALGAERGAAGAGLSAIVHDFDALDRRLLLSQTGTPDPNAAPALRWQTRLKAAAGSGAGHPARSIAAIQADLHRAEREANQEAARWIERGRLAEAEGKPNVAKIYYNMAARRATGPERDEVLARIAARKPPSAAGSDRKPDETRQ